MPADVLVGVVALLEQCAQRRAGIIVGDDALHARRMLQAEVAGRELIAALVRPVPGDEWGLAYQVRRLVGYVQTVVAASATACDLTPLITIRSQHLAADAATTRVLCHTAMIVLLAALDDDATEIDLCLVDDTTGIILTIESNRSGITSATQPLQAVQHQIAADGGTWHTAQAAHGGSWLVHVTMPWTTLVGHALVQTA